MCSNGGRRRCGPTTRGQGGSRSADSRRLGSRRTTSGLLKAGGTSKPGLLSSAGAASRGGDCTRRDSGEPRRWWQDTKSAARTLDRARDALLFCSLLLVPRGVLALPRRDAVRIPPSRDRHAQTVLSTGCESLCTAPPRAHKGSTTVAFSPGTRSWVAPSASSPSQRRMSGTK